MGDIIVTPWGTKTETTEDPTAPYHDCLWQIAEEQAMLARIQRGESAEGVTDREIRTQLDTVCDDNGFRRLDGSGHGRDPNLIYDGETIRVRINPTDITKAPPGVSAQGTPSGDAYTRAVAGPGGAPDGTKKTQLDTWIGTMPGFQNLNEEVKAGLITAWAAGSDPQKLTTLVNSSQFSNSQLTDRQRKQLVSVYGARDQGYLTGQIEGMLGQPVNDQNTARLKLMATEGFARLDAGQQQRLLQRYADDAEFRAAINQIIGQPNFLDKEAMPQAHALDILYRYSGRRRDGYGYQDTEYRQRILVRLYDDILNGSDYGLTQVTNTQENEHQGDLIKDYAEETVPQMVRDLRNGHTTTGTTTNSNYPASQSGGASAPPTDDGTD